MSETQKTILIVDDDRSLLSTMKILFTHNDYNVFTASNGDEAIELAKKHKPDIVLLDVLLPGKNGFEVLDILKSNPSTSDIFVVLLTAQATSVDDRSSAFNSGADGYLIKPVYNEELLARIESFLRHKRTIDKLAESESKLKAALNRDRFLADIVRNATVGIGKLYPDGRTELLNEACLDICGYTREEINSLNWKTDLTPKERRKRDEEILEEIDKYRTVKRYEKEFFHKNGKKVPVEITLHPYFGKTIDLDYLLAFITDITERKEIEKERDEKIQELQKMNKFMVGRENKMIELKQEINELLKRLGEPPKYSTPV